MKKTTKTKRLTKPIQINSSLANAIFNDRNVETEGDWIVSNEMMALFYRCMEYFHAIGKIHDKEWEQTLRNIHSLLVKRYEAKLKLKQKKRQKNATNICKSSSM